MPKKQGKTHFRQNEAGTARSYMDVPVYFNGTTFYAPTLGIYNVEEYRDMKVAIREKLLARQQTQRESFDPMQYMVDLLNESISREINEEFEKYFGEECDSSKKKKKNKDKGYEKNVEVEIPDVN